mmetsp:Transcript_4913/g.14242  ORF Transcript_4913/g.14242 Transcript_4913/m.14242 type:complete len:253 (-) Transcript_4913:155-913(-)
MLPKWRKYIILVILPDDSNVSPPCRLLVLELEVLLPERLLRHRVRHVGDERSVYLRLVPKNALNILRRQVNVHALCLPVVKLLDLVHDRRQAQPLSRFHRSPPGVGGPPAPSRPMLRPELGLCKYARHNQLIIQRFEVFVCLEQRPPLSRSEPPGGLPVPFPLLEQLKHLVPIFLRTKSKPKRLAARRHDPQKRLALHLLLPLHVVQENRLLADRPGRLGTPQHFDVADGEYTGYRVLAFATKLVSGLGKQD